MPRPPLDLTPLRAQLRAWHAGGQRDLPWRRDPTPYRTLVSEFMLQQTRVDTVLPRWDPWFKRFPTLRSLAESDWDTVRAAWSGLGYYQRARRLHNVAKILFRDGWPSTYEAWLDLPGIGPYTAGALTCFILGQPAAAVDGNVERVLVRLLGGPERVLTGTDRRRIQSLAMQFSDPDDPGGHLQALLDLGATVCTPGRPKCGDCPLRHDCIGFARGIQDRIPVPKLRQAVREEQKSYVFVLREDTILLRPQPEGGLLEGAWRPPLVDEVQWEPIGDLVEAHTHLFSHRKWEMTIREGTLTADPPEPFQWVRIQDYAKLPRSTAYDRILETMLGPVPNDS